LASSTHAAKTTAVRPIPCALCVSAFSGALCTSRVTVPKRETKYKRKVPQRARKYKRELREVVSGSDGLL